MLWINRGLCVLLIIGLTLEVILILTRNKRILVKGKDDILVFAIAVVAAMLLFPLSEVVIIEEGLRNVLLLVFLFASLAIRRGISEKGIEKVCFTIPWAQITDIRVSSYQVSKIQLVCTAWKMRFKLQFPRFKLNDLLLELQKHYKNVYLQENLRIDIERDNTL